MSLFKEDKNANKRLVDHVDCWRWKARGINIIGLDQLF